MHKYWRGQLVFEVAATDLEMAYNKAFGVLIDACRMAKQEGFGRILRPSYNLDNPNLWNPYLGRFKVTYPAPVDEGKKILHAVEIDIEYVKVDLDWASKEEARQWLFGLFLRSQTAEVQLTIIKESSVVWS